MIIEVMDTTVSCGVDITDQAGNELPGHMLIALRTLRESPAVLAYWATIEEGLTVEPHYDEPVVPFDALIGPGAEIQILRLRNLLECEDDETVAIMLMEATAAKLWRLTT